MPWNRPFGSMYARFMRASVAAASRRPLIALPRYVCKTQRASGWAGFWAGGGGSAGSAIPVGAFNAVFFTRRALTARGRHRLRPRLRRRPAQRPHQRQRGQHQQGRLAERPCETLPGGAGRLPDDLLVEARLRLEAILGAARVVVQRRL